MGPLSAVSFTRRSHRKNPGLWDPVTWELLNDFKADLETYTSRSHTVAAMAKAPESGGQRQEGTCPPLEP